MLLLYNQLYLFDKRDQDKHVFKQQTEDIEISAFYAPLLLNISSIINRFKRKIQVNALFSAYAEYIYHS